jgi:crotonobetainyl-CoA:carnitine CoA-transferase CaiB-like acyl-CoA transferase
LLEDARFATVASRARYVNEWFEVRGTPLTNRSTKQWLDILRAADIAAKPCHTLESLQRDPHLEAVDLVRFEEHPTEGRTAAIRSTIRFDDDYPPLRSPSQPKGWETSEILEEIGCSATEIDALLADGAALRAAASPASN